MLVDAVSEVPVGPVHTNVLSAALAQSFPVVVGEHFNVQLVKGLQVRPLLGGQRRRERRAEYTSGGRVRHRRAFGGLQQLLWPVRAQASGLAPAYQSALDSALGLGGSEPPEHFRIALAALDLLSNAATDRPLLLVAEDVHWLDQPSVDVLSFVARRLEAEPIVLLATPRAMATRKSSTPVSYPSFGCNRSIQDPQLASSSTPGPWCLRQSGLAPPGVRR